jgi:uracil-DNA glycosylase family 4
LDAPLYKQKLLDALYAPYKNCTACPLASLGRKTIVFGDGNANAKLMFIGEGPGKDENIQGRPFVGRSGQLLTKILETIGLNRADVFITNVVKCRPPKNRAPLPTESTMCKSILLLKQIEIIRPKIICTLGASATQELLNKPIEITKVRGTRFKLDECTVIPTYHPAYALRNPNKLAILIQDIQQAYTLSQDVFPGG